MARVLLLSGDLLFGSRVQGDLVAAGHEVEILGDEERLRSRLSGPGATSGPRAARDPGAGADASAPGDSDGAGGPGARRAEALVADLTDDRLDAAGIVERLTADGGLAGVPTLAFYSHVDVSMRERAEGAGFDMVVPRSRMAREGAGLIEALIEEK